MFAGGFVIPSNIMSQDQDRGTRRHDADVALADPKTKTKKPPYYNVLLLNDDYTPMEFVVHVLCKFFAMTQDRATQIMMTVHTKGKGVCGTYTREVAETHMLRINQYARANKHPLQSRIEAVR